MSIKNLVRYYNQDDVALVMLKKHKYICTNNYDESYREFANKPKIVSVIADLAKQENMFTEYSNNRSNAHLKRPNAIVLSYRGYTFIHPHLANLFFATNYPDICLHVFKFYEQKTYLHSDNPRNLLYVSQEDGCQNWIKTFADRLFEMFYKLYGIENTGKPYQHPLYFAKLINKYIYAQLPVFGSEEVSNELKELRETDDTRNFIVKLHQYLDDKGRDILIATIYQVMAYIDSACSLYPDLSSRKAWLDSILNDKRTGQLRLPTDTFNA